MTRADVLLQIRRDVASAWAQENPLLASGEIGAETDTGRMKIGDGSRAWSELPYVGQSLPGSSVDGGTYTGTI